MCVCCVVGRRMLRGCTESGDVTVYVLCCWTQDAERMHRKAIEIKQQLLGDSDYEVALSVGHLASLYNYDMHKFHEAEPLYLQSIKIGTFFLFFTRTA